MTNKTIWRLPKVLHHTGLSRSKIYDMVTRGEFPQQVKLGRRAVGWVAQDVYDWIDGRIELSSGARCDDAAEDCRKSIEIE